MHKCKNCETLTIKGDTICGVVNSSSEWKPFIRDERIDNPYYSGCFSVVENNVVKSVYIKQVLYNEPVVVVWWSDGTQTKSKVRGADEYSMETGLLYCILKKVSSGANLEELFSDWTPTQRTIDNKNLYVNMKDVRGKHKAK